jgi:Methyltransferase FkbM domain
VNNRKFESFSQNGEDVVLFRALRGVEHGRYIEVVANHPWIFSVSMAFYHRGWSGITIEPDPEFARMLRDERPRDIVVESAITSKAITSKEGATTRRLDRILEDIGWQGLDIHFMAVNTEGSERDVLESIDLTVWRPWILVVEGTGPNRATATGGQWESLVTAAGYRLCLFDGVSSFYVASERFDRLGESLSFPAGARDDYSTLELREAESALREAESALRDARTEASSIPVLVAEVARWRTEAISRWADVMATRADKEELVRLRIEFNDLHRRYQTLAREHHELSERCHGMFLQIQDLHGSTSWRLTAPLRTASRILARPKMPQ